MVGELAGIRHIGGDQKGGMAADLVCNLRLVHSSLRHDLPLLPRGLRTMTRTAWLAMARMRDEVCLHVQPLRAALELLGKCCLGVGMAGKATVAQMPNLAFPFRAGLHHLAWQGRPCPVLSLGDGHDDPRSSVGTWAAGAPWS